MRFHFLCVTFLCLFNHLMAQTGLIGPVNFNLEVGKSETANGGLTVVFQEVNSKIVNIDQATLPGHPPKSLKKRVFTLELMVSNSGKSDIAIYDWVFNAICPENNLGLEWQENSMVPITTAYIPNSLYIVLKPGEQKVLQAVPTDFFWCQSKNENGLLRSPKFLKAIVICGLLNMPKQINTTIDPLLLQLIKEYHDLLEIKEVAKAEEKKSLILQIAKAEPENLQIQILNMLKFPEKKENYSLRKETKKLAYPKELDVTNETSNPNKMQTNESNYFGTSWYFLQSDKPLQFRMSLSRLVDEVGYLKLQVRINKNVGVYCKTANCEGYIWLMSYNNPDGTLKKHHFYFPNNFDGIYELSFEIPFLFKPLPNGLKPFWNKEKHLVYYLNPVTNEEKQAYPILNCVDNKMTNYNQHRCSGFKMEEAIVINNFDSNK